jgi:hypothetical protein
MELSNKRLPDLDLFCKSLGLKFMLKVKIRKISRFAREDEGADADVFGQRLDYLAFFT